MGKMIPAKNTGYPHRSSISRRKRSCLQPVILLLFLFFLSVTGSDAQTISIRANKISLKKVLEAIKKQTSYDVIYNARMIDSCGDISVNAKDQPLESFMRTILSNQPLSFTIVGNAIVIRKKSAGSGQLDDPTQAMANEVFTGFVIDDNTKTPVYGASVVVKRTGRGTQTDVVGKFTLNAVQEKDSISFSMIGYQSITLAAGKTRMVMMKTAVNNLDEAVVQAYGITSKRLTTANITRISGDEIRKQPVMNPILALQGRVPGLIISPTLGNSSAPVKVELRGRNSITQAFSGEPLYIIDGVPRTVLDLGSAYTFNQGISPGFIQAGISNVGGQSILFGMNPKDIESIEVLKDGDATAIYGSRAANGVILITTKKAKGGKTRASVSVQQGYTDIPRHVKMLGTKEYLAMRREAFKNDGVTPNNSNAPDLTLWDSTRYTDWQRELLKTGKTINISAELAGGDTRNNFRLSANYMREQAMINRSGKNEVMSGAFSFGHRSLDQKLNMNLRVEYMRSLVDAINFSKLDLPPNAPALFDDKGNLNFAGYGGSPFESMFLSALLQPSIAVTNSFMSSLNISYELMNGLTLSTRFGLNNARNTNDYFQTIKSQNPAMSPMGLAYFGNTSTSNWIIEPQLTYSRFLGKGRIEVLAGATVQRAFTNSLTTVGMGYTNDALIGSINHAQIQQSIDVAGQYRYAGVFGRINYNWENKYILNLNGRRDGSSRFGPGKQFGNFGSVGASWIASEEKWVKSNLPSWFNFIKFRGSYAITGNDNIGDYQFASQWGNAPQGPGSRMYNYNGVTPYVPVHAVNQLFHWERNKKLDIGLSLGFMQEKINLELAYFRNLADDQLVGFPTPIVSGFESIVANSPAKVENTGFDIALNARIIEKKDFNLSASFTLGFIRNKLLAYPGLESSPYASRYTIGQSLNSEILLHYVGIDPLTGNYSFEDYNKDGEVSSNSSIPGGTGKDDRYVAVDRNPQFDGGFTTSMNYKQFSLSVGFIFRKQVLPNPFLYDAPGRMKNLYLPEDALQHYWRKPGDQAKYPRFTTGSTGNLSSSDGYFTDGSFLRMNNISLGYSLPDKTVQKAGFTDCRFSINVNNIFTITRYRGIDPNILNQDYLPSPRIIVANLSFTL